MKKFIIHSIIFLSFVLGSIYGIFLSFDGYTDPFYIRFTTPQQKSLIIGTSRAAQGIRPDIINKEIKSDIFNYAFTIGHSPYGPSYYHSIYKKLNKKLSSERIFIVAVDPWSVASKNKNNPNDSLFFSEKKLFLGILKNVNTYPNVDYIMKFYHKPHFQILKSKFSENVHFLHDDGWYEINVKIDTTRFQKKIDKKMIAYFQKEKIFGFSSKRLHYLAKIIELFQQHKGQVYLVRIPIHQRMMNIENRFMPNFNQKIDSLALKYQIPYFDMTYLNKEMIYTDGNHLHKDSGKEFTKILAEKIKQEQNKK